MGKRLIATGTTDSNGQVKITYTGKGAGKLQLTAESGTLTSPTYELIDSVLRDGGVTDDHNNNAFGYNTTYITASTNTTGTTVENLDTSGFRAYTSRNPTNNSYNWDGDYAIEMDIISGDEGVRMQLYTDNSNVISRTLSELGLTSGGHLRIEYSNGTATYYVDGTQSYTRTLSLTTYNIRMFLSASSTFTYKNFMVYPI